MTGRIFFKRFDKLKILQFSFFCIYLIYSKLAKIFNGLSIVMRYCYYRRKLKKCGSNVSIHNMVKILYPENIQIGDNVSIHSLSYIDGEGGIEIGNNVSIAHNTTIMSANHTWGDLDIPIKYNPKSIKGVKIHDDVWIGAGVRIMDGVTIQKRCVVGAGAIVIKDCEANGLYAGVPARRIRSI